MEIRKTKVDARKGLLEIRFGNQESDYLLSCYRDEGRDIVELGSRIHRPDLEPNPEDSPEEGLRKAFRTVPYSWTRGREDSEETLIREVLEDALRQKRITIRQLKKTGLRWRYPSWLL